MTLDRRTLLAAGAGLFAAGCSRPARPPGPPLIRINTAGLLGEAGIFLAQDYGYFAQQGVRVELIPAAANASTDSLAQLATGDLDAASFGPTAALFNAIDRGFDVVGLMPLNTLAPGDMSRGIVVREDLIRSGRYGSPADLRGLRIGTLTIGGAGHFFLLEALAAAGLTSDDISLETLPMPDTVVALTTRSLDAAFLVEPFLATTQAKGIARLMIPASQTSSGVPTAVLFGSRDFIRDHPGAMESFTTAVLRGQRDYVRAVTTGQGRDRLFDTLARHTAIKDRERLEKLAFPYVDPSGKYDPAGVVRIQRFFLGSGIQRRIIPPEQVFDDHFAAHARRQLGTI